MDVLLVKKKLLTINSTGVFVNFDPIQISQIYKELKQVLVSGDSIEVTELYDLYELHVYLSLITNNDTEAKTYIDRLVDQFGDESSERINLLKSLYLEAVGRNKEATDILSARGNELMLTRRLTTFLRNSKDNNIQYIKNLNLYLDLQPSDLITWAELAEQYENLGHYDKAIFCLKEILVQEPLAYATHYKVGLLNYYLFMQKYKDIQKDIIKKDKLLELTRYLINARNNYLRSIEICKDHKKSWLGIYLLCQLKFTEKLKVSSKEIDEFKTGVTKLKALSKNKVQTLIGDIDDITVQY